MLSRCIFVWIFFSCLCPAFAQENMVYYDPAKNPAFSIKGLQGIRNPDSPYFRLEVNMESKVSKQLWRLSKHTAGVSISFATDAPEIVVRYGIGGGLQMQHMPATGVSGVDLYIHKNQKKWIWIPGRFSFRDTVIYRYENIDQAEGVVQDFQVYLPLYNSVKWLEIGIASNKKLAAIKSITQKPIVVYGTSIAQGACASRPGLAWPAIVERELNRPMINFGFSGNGLLDSAIVQLMTKTDAAVYILDCLPNLIEQNLDSAQLKARFAEALRLIREARPHTPVIITLHPYYPDRFFNKEKRLLYNSLNRWTTEAVQTAKRSGYKDFFIMTAEMLSIGMESTVDGVHPNDHGMFQYASAYVKLLRKILQ